MTTRREEMLSDDSKWKAFRDSKIEHYWHDCYNVMRHGIYAKTECGLTVMGPDGIGGKGKRKCKKCESLIIYGGIDAHTFGMPRWRGIK